MKTKKELVEHLKQLVAEERKITAKIISYLEEVNERKIYRDWGYSTLFAFSVEELQYSESAAMRRILAMRLAEDIPEIKEKLESGVLSLTNISRAQTFIVKQKIQAPEEKRKLLEKLEKKSTRQAQRYLASLAPQAPRPDVEKPISGELTEYRFTANSALAEKLKRVRAKWSHKNPNYSMAKLIEALCDQALREPKQKSRPRTESRELLTANRKQNQQQQQSGMPAPVITRHISAQVKRETRAHADYRCEFVSLQTGRRCDSIHLLEYDHILPHAFDGPDTAENLRLYCWAHNQLAAEQWGFQMPS